MKDFEKFILEKHPDPDSLLENEEIYNQFVRLAEAYADKKIRPLKNCFEETIWMAIRYAHGRHTFAPLTVRDAIRDFKTVFPYFKVKEDITIKPPKEGAVGGFKFRSDYLDDLFNNK